jgi:WhiB family redox-sensing transcriptional regulator
MATNNQPSLVDYYRTRAVQTLPAPSTAAWDWQLHGSCRGMDPRDFLSQRTISTGQRRSACKAVCSTCPVVDQCREYAIDAAEPYGVWGGLTPLERAMLTPHTQLTGPTPSHCR